jgi:hypothetical protein
VVQALGLRRPLRPPLEFGLLEGGQSCPQPAFSRLRIWQRLEAVPKSGAKSQVRNRKLTIGANATVHACVEAREVVLLGTVRGDVKATDKIEIRKDASLVGDIRTPRIIIEDGAYFKGSIDIVQIKGSRLALLGSREADEADERAELDLENEGTSRSTTRTR